MQNPQPGQQQGTSSNFWSFLSQSPTIMACFENAFPNYQMLMQPGQQGMAGGAGAQQQQQPGMAAGQG